MNAPETIRVGRAMITPSVAAVVADLQEAPELAAMYIRHLHAISREIIMDPERDNEETAQETLGRLRALQMLAIDIATIARLDDAVDAEDDEPDPDPTEGTKSTTTE